MTEIRRRRVLATRVGFEPEPYELSEPEPEAQKKLNGNRVISVDEPFLAFKVIANNCDLEYIRKLGLLLASITEAMTID